MYPSDCLFVLEVFHSDSAHPGWAVVSALGLLYFLVYVYKLDNINLVEFYGNSLFVQLLRSYIISCTRWYPCPILYWAGDLSLTHE